MQPRCSSTTARSTCPNRHDPVRVPDSLILERADADGRIVLTHDPDFGRLALHGSAISTGVVFLRPGHISSGIVLATLEAANTAAGDLSTPFLLTVEQKSQSGLRIRVRQLPIGG